jgi:DNA gyrase/topoisomerase IV subunit B
MNLYNDDSIQTLTGLLPYRYRPQTYIKNSSVAGQCHLVYELIVNSLDESIQASLEGITTGQYELYFFRNKELNRYQILSKDYYRGVPLNKLHDVILIGNTSGKYNTDNYTFSGGSIGVGNKVVAALSKVLVANSYRDKLCANIKVQDAVDVTESKELYTNSIAPDRTGLDVFFEIEPSLFIDIPEMIDTGINYLENLIKKISIFNLSNRCIIYLIDQLLYTDLSTVPCNPNQFQKDIQNFLNSNKDITQIVLDTNTFDSDPLQYLSSIWNINSDITWKSQIQYTDNTKLSFNIYLFNTKILPNKTTFYSILNNLIMERIDSSHVKTFLTLLKNKLSNYIEDNKDLLEYFNNVYKLPIYFAINLLYSGAVYQGFLKDSFTDRTFEQLFIEILLNKFEEISESEWFKLFKTFEKDLLTKYNSVVKKYTENKTFNTLLTTLNKSQNFFDCSTKNREEAELFLVEGGSAGASMTHRDSVTQAYLLLQGKPINVVKGYDKEEQSIKLLNSNLIMQDLCKILGIKPGQKDFEKLNFGKIFLFQDADSDGRHIRELLIGNLYYINPKIISSGMVHLVIPPLYRVSSKSNPKKKFFVRDSDTLLKIKIDYIFRKSFELGVIGLQPFNKYTVLKDDVYTAAVYIIYEIGKLFEYISSLTVIPAIILEKLINVYEYLSINTINLNKIKESLQTDKIDYNALTHSLIVSFYEKDIVINLTGIMEELEQKVFPVLNIFHWNKFKFCLTTLGNKTLYNQTNLPITTLYHIFEKTNDLFYIERLKGLGSMKPEEAKLTCLDKETRLIYPIHEIGDLNMIIGLLGDDVQSRKDLLNRLDLFA